MTFFINPASTLTPLGFLCVFITYLSLLSPLFMLLYSAALTIAVPSSLVSRGFGWRSWGVFTGLRHDLLADSRSLTTYPNICGMYCTGFHSHSASHTRSHPWCGGACLAGRPPVCASSVALSSCAGRRTLTVVLCPR